VNESIAIRTDDLSKSFGRGRKRIQAVKNLSLEIRTGQVYGFLGLNGSGKTTTIRMLMDLIRPSQGEVTLLGCPVREQHGVLRRVGAIVERASFYDFLSARKNMEVLARTGGLTGSNGTARRITMLLEQVGLVGQADQRVGGYSTGMKQRLGLAAALLHDPDLLILDEPAGGLDPAGRQEIRRILRNLVDKQGKTVFLSSHLLGEIEQVCDRVAVIHKGRLVGEGAVADLLVGRPQIRVEARPLDGAVGVLRQDWPVSRNRQQLIATAQHHETPHIVRRLVAQGIDVYAVTYQRQTLEHFFLSVTQKGMSDGFQRD
jgi:ABC-2 type transport system ATP-binding protein